MAKATGIADDPLNKAIIALMNTIMFESDPYFKRLGAIGFYNHGYWKEADDSVEIAQINLIETLVDFFTDKTGSVLDVACGIGVSTRFLTKYFDVNKVVGINISERQLDSCKTFVPECTFRLMDAVNLDFDDSSFDNILCIDSAPNFNTRRRFLEEARRVLKPGGRLAMSDRIYSRDDFLSSVHPKENYLPDFDSYRRALIDVGFNYARVEDITEHSIHAFLRLVTRKIERDFTVDDGYDRLLGLMKNDESSIGGQFSAIRCGLVFAIK